VSTLAIPCGIGARPRASLTDVTARPIRRSTLGRVKARTQLAALAALVAACAAPTTASAALRGADGAPRVALPGDAAAAGVQADPAGWIVGAQPGRAAARIARAHGARHIAGGAWRTSRTGARDLAADLRAAGLLRYAEPDRYSTRTQAPAPDPLSASSPWRTRIVDPSLVPPPVTPASPLIALVDSQLDITHPEFKSGNVATTGGQPLTDFHGTATAAVAAAGANGVGNLGVWPGARALNVALPSRILCSDSARQIDAARRAGAAVINMSYGSTQRCTTEADAIQRAVRAGIVPVAASGNEFDQGNPNEFPAMLPHVLTVAALAEDDRPTFFSSESAAVDVSAPGMNVLTAVPARSGKDFDGDGQVDGFASVSGTSFSAPMVSGAVAWIRAARPELTQDQVQNVMRFGARDIGDPEYEPATGYGILSVAGALARPAPPADAAEPNDDVRFVDGRAFGKAAKPVFRKDGRTATVSATADVFEDPIDVYRIKVRAGSRAKIRLAPSVGDPDLYVFRGGVRSVGAAPLARSRKGTGRTDSATVRNRRGWTATYFLAVGFSRDKRPRLLNASYSLRVSR
jgi:hypothetical protein